jgi:aminopeptidase-like protein
MRLYRPNEPIWGFCLPQSIAETLPDGDYDVDLRTRLVPSTMKVFLHELPGETEEVILFNAHNCHPFQANDDISGIVVGIELMRRLAGIPRRRHSYALMVAPELFGPMFWLDGLVPEQWKKIKGTVMLKSVGNDRPLRLQQSFQGNAELDLAAHNIFRQRYTIYGSGEFRAIYGNDETVFEVPPYSIPSISVTRWPFLEYHTDQDVPACLHELRLQDTVDTVFKICEALEMNLRPLTTVKGLACLSRYGLYKSVPPVGPDGVDYTSLPGRWNRLMNSLPRLMDGRTSLIEIAESFQLPITEVHSYIKKWISHGLASHN